MRYFLLFILTSLFQLIIIYQSISQTSTALRRRLLVETLRAIPHRRQCLLRRNV